MNKMKEYVKYIEMAWIHIFSKYFSKTYILHHVKHEKVGVLFARLPSMLVNMCIENMWMENLEQILHRFASLLTSLLAKFLA